MRGRHSAVRHCAAFAALALAAALALLLPACGGGGAGGGSFVPPPPTPISITTSSLPDGVTGTAYTQTTVQASGGTGARSWSATGLPAGLSIGASTGTISGTPTASGSFTVTVQVQDSSSPPRTASRQLTLRIADPLSISTASLPNGAVGTPYSQTVTATGGLAPFTWDISAGSLPNGISLSASTTNSVTVSGNPTAGGSISFTVRVVDSLNPQQSATKAFTIKILQITSASLPDGVQNQSYGPATIGVIGNVGTLTWSQTGLPANLSLNSSTGVVSGTPTGTGTSNVNVTVSDSNGPRSTSRTLSLRIDAVLQITTASLAAGTTGVAYSQTLAATGGRTPYTWSEPTFFFDTSTGQGVVACEGLTLSFSAGTISGAPVNVGTCGSFTLKVTDAASPAQTDQAAFSIPITAGPLSIVTSSLPPGSVNNPYSVTLEAKGGTPPFTWSETTTSFSDTTGAGTTATPCQGLTFRFFPGTISGTPVNQGTCGPFDLRVDDAAAAFATKSGLSILINPEPVSRNDTVATATVLTNTAGQTFAASISPFADTDFYKVTAAAGATVTVEIFARRVNPATSVNLNSKLDSVLLIVRDDSSLNGNPFNTCNDPGDDNPPVGLPLTPDSTPTGFDDLCINDDIQLGTNRDSRLQFKVPMNLGNPVTFYIRVLDFRGDGRPDFRYEMTISGAN